MVHTSSYSDTFETPVLTAGQTFILGYTNETEGIFPASKDNPVIIFDDFTTAFKWVEFPFKAKSSAMKMITTKSESLESLRYAYYAMSTISYSPRIHARQWIGTYSKFRIPVPPHEVQQEIVAILDKFDALVNDLSDGLPAEIAARRKQYEHYRDKLLTFKEAA
ncbi:MAG: restriction endonuclease subunit S [Rhodobacteraceae bacterium]|nr:restriction endonuclease subunit S [Paracoccaceae bacterium]